MNHSDWISVEDRMPTEADANDQGEVLWLYMTTLDVTLHRWDQPGLGMQTHWMSFVYPKYKRKRRSGVVGLELVKGTRDGATYYHTDLKLNTGEMVDVIERKPSDPDPDVCIELLQYLESVTDVGPTAKGLIDQCRVPEAPRDD